MNKENKILLLFIAVVVVIIAVFLAHKQHLKVDKDNETKIRQLHPKLRNKARKFINLAKRKGYDLRITESLRTWDRQNKLYAQGRTEPGKIVTNAKAGSSYHNYGLAFDVVDKKNGYSTNWAEIGKLGKKAGFEWGGDWANFKDKPHFQLTLGHKIADLKKLYTSGHWKNYPIKQNALNGMFENEIEKFVKKSIKTENKNLKDKIYIGYINLQLANKIKKYIDVNTYNFSIILQADEVRKIFKDHSESSVEMKKGQLPINRNDFKNLTAIINKPDFVDKGYDKQNLKNVILIKYFSKEKMFTVLEIHVSNGYVIIKSIYKKSIKKTL